MPTADNADRSIAYTRKNEIYNVEYAVVRGIDNSARSSMEQKRGCSVFCRPPSLSLSLSLYKLEHNSMQRHVRVTRGERTYVVERQFLN